MVLERVGDLDHVLEPRLHDLFVPEREARLRPVLVAALPEPSEELLQRPRLARVERAFQKVVAVRDRLVAKSKKLCVMLVDVVVFHRKELYHLPKGIGCRARSRGAGMRPRRRRRVGRGRSPSREAAARARTKAPTIGDKLWF